jgi:hypothetical protein
LTATLTGTGGAISPTGSVSFLDENNAGYALSTVALGSSVVGFSFVNSANLGNAIGQGGILSADFNGDGILDLAVVDLPSNAVTILLGKGDGTFTQLPANAPTGCSL